MRRELTLDSEDLAEVLQAFVGRMPRGWKVYDSDGRIGAYTGRRFEYRSGNRALLSVQPLRFNREYLPDPVDRVREWSAQVNVPFSAGPEVFDQGNLVQIEEWVQKRDGWLALPYVLQECKGREEAECIAATLPNHGITLLAAVFDIDIYESRAEIVRKLAAACVPAASKGEGVTHGKRR
jgi:hypothetical protein